MIAALLLLALPVLALAGQCIRLGAPARDRRLAAIRLAGATPRQAVLIAVAETVAAGLLGSVRRLRRLPAAAGAAATGRNAEGESGAADRRPAVTGGASWSIILLVPVLAGAGRRAAAAPGR